MRERDKLRVGLLGVGAIAQVVHLPVLSQLKNVELLGVGDADQPRARAIASRFGIPQVFARDEDAFTSDDSTPSSSARPPICTSPSPLLRCRVASTSSWRSPWPRPPMPSSASSASPRRPAARS
jgi:hypothetical protein